MDVIVSVTANWGIGHRGNLLVPNHQDMRRFKTMTEGGIVICGRSTYESFPASPLPNRLNIVISSQRLPPVDGVMQAGSIEEATELASEVASDRQRIWVIGGASVYQQMLPMCDRAYVTRHGVTLPADAFFPNLDEDPRWHAIDQSPEMVTKGGVPFRFVTYGNVHAIG